MIFYLLLIFTIIIIIYVIIIKNRTKLYFKPNKNIKMTPKVYGIEYNDVIINKIHGWFYNNKKFISYNSGKLKSNKLIIYFNGNSGNTSTRIKHYERLQNIFTEYDFFVFDYPQFGLSEGNLDIKNIINISFEIYLFWTNKYNDITLIGESIGAGVISELYNKLIKKKIKIMPNNIIHLNGIVSFYKIINLHIPYKLNLFITPWIKEFNIEKIYTKHKIYLPKIILIHAIDDNIVPFYFVEKMANKFNLTLITIYGNHNNYIFTEKNIYDILNILD